MKSFHLQGHRNALSNEGVFFKNIFNSGRRDDRPGIIALVASALAKENINIKNIGILNSRETEDGALEIQVESEESRLRSIEILSSMGYRTKQKH